MVAKTQMVTNGIEPKGYHCPKGNDMVYHGGQWVTKFDDDPSWLEDAINGV